MSQAAEEIAKYGLKPDAYMGLTSFAIILVAVILSLRIYVRTVIIKSFGLDDWLLLLSFCIFVADAAVIFRSGLITKRHGITAVLLEVSALDIASMLLYIMNQVFLKLSIALFFLRIPQRRWQIWTIRVSVTIFTIYSTGFFFLALFKCGSPDKFNFIYGHCLSWDILGWVIYTSAILNAIVDWILITTPILVIWGSMMSRQSKVQVCAILMLGIAGSLLSVARIPFIKHLRIIHSPEYFGQLVPITMLSGAETAVGIGAISLAALRPLLKRWQAFRSCEDEESLSKHNSLGNAVPLERTESTEMYGHVIQLPADHVV
ncbi:hypothetical protein K461DRAFT_298000 [Myriangium duriaei CBS 260.36]|uniref:Rhodopsin domain-containing protein n=1 Tax=Myriangium duriaei CBS 260.36 TaxID=1168546 RepID=A0A9P4IVN2_9PEZI|nr:hypothetical protein K461DRAFT_298000 [Myriangium duriaei CBS 260.36]